MKKKQTSRLYFTTLWLKKINFYSTYLLCTQFWGVKIWFTFLQMKLTWTKKNQSTYEMYWINLIKLHGTSFIYILFIHVILCKLFKLLYIYNDLYLFILVNIFKTYWATFNYEAILLNFLNKWINEIRSTLIRSIWNSPEFVESITFINAFSYLLLKVRDTWWRLWGGF